MTNPADSEAWLDTALFPYAQERVAAARAHATRFAYYTTAETAYKILSSREIWLRNAKLMNDFSEVEHGLRCLSAAFRSPLGNRLWSVLDECAPGAMAQIGSLFSERLPNFELDTFLTCFSEHLTSEDSRGRLSMWRAYGGATGVALVFNPTAILGNSSATSVVTSPVLYADPTSFVSALERVVTNMEQSRGQLKALGPERVQTAVFNVFMYAVLCTKHPGFAEEREWRAIASPSLTGTNRLAVMTEIIDGIPQRVLKLPLANAPEEGFVGLEVAELIERVIIGPCAHPQITYLAFVELLTAIGIPDANKRVHVTDIPLRHDA